MEVVAGKMKKDWNKRGQSIFGMSFEVIFSIILIAFIIVVGIIVVKYFLNFQKCGEIKIFVDDFKLDVERTWKSDELGFDFERRLSGVDMVCFMNLSENVKGEWKDIGFEIKVYDDENMFFYPLDVCSPAHRVKHLNMDEIVRFNNPYCLKVVNGKAVIRIEKGVNEGLVRIK